MDSVDHSKFMLSPNVHVNGSEEAYDLFKSNILKRHRDLKSINLASGLESYTREEELENGGIVNYIYNYGNEHIIVDMPKNHAIEEEQLSKELLYDEYITVIKESFYLGHGNWKTTYSGYKFDPETATIVTEKKEIKDENGDIVEVEKPVKADILQSIYDLTIFEETGFLAFMLGKYNFQVDNKLLPPLFEKNISSNRYCFNVSDIVKGSFLDPTYKRYYFPYLHSPYSMEKGYVEGFAARYKKEKIILNGETVTKNTAFYLFAYVERKQTYVKCAISSGGLKIYTYSGVSVSLPVTARSHTIIMNRDTQVVSWDVFIDKNFDAWFLHMFDMGNMNDEKLPIFRGCITERGDFQYKIIDMPNTDVRVSVAVNDDQGSDSDGASHSFGEELKIGQGLIYGEPLNPKVSCSADVGAMAKSSFISYTIDGDSVNLEEGESLNPAWITYHGDGVGYSFMPKYSLKVMQHGEGELIEMSGGGWYMMHYPTTGIKRAKGTGSASANKVIEYRSENKNIELNYQRHYDRKFDLHHNIYGYLNTWSKDVYDPSNRILLFSWSHGYWYNIANGITPGEPRTGSIDYPFDTKDKKYKDRNKTRTSYIYADSIRHFIDYEHEEENEKIENSSGFSSAYDGVSSHWENRYSLVGYEDESIGTNIARDFRTNCEIPIHRRPTGKDAKHCIEWRVDNNDGTVHTDDPKNNKNSFHTEENFGSIINTSYLEDDMYAIGWCVGYEYDSENKSTLIAELRVQKKGYTWLQPPDDEGVQRETILPIYNKGKRYKDHKIENNQNLADFFEQSVKRWLGHGFYYRGINFTYDPIKQKKDKGLGIIKREVMGVYKVKKFQGKNF